MISYTDLLHSVSEDPQTGSISTPIYQTSTFVQEAPGVNKGYDYARSNNPTRTELENTLAKLEGGTAAFAFASGLSAIDTVFKLLSSGDEIVAVKDIYGGTYRALEHIYAKLGIKVHYIDTTDVENIRSVISDKTALLWIESPTNPTLKITDIKAAAKIAKENGVLTLVDNTFCSPVAQSPFDLGADIIVHSATKYLGGHSDIIAGAVVVNSEELSERVKYIQNTSGAILGPIDSWLLLRGLQTLHLRVIHQFKSAEKVAIFLNEHPSVGLVNYPGLKHHKNHDVAARQQKYFGGVISFTIKDGDLESTSEFVSSLKYFKLAESLGGLKSLICQPAQMTHKSTPPEVRKNAGVFDNLVRISVGAEDPEVLIKDLDKALVSGKIARIQKEPA